MAARALKNGLLTMTECLPVADDSCPPGDKVRQTHVQPCGKGVHQGSDDEDRACALMNCLVPVADIAERSTHLRK
jgi:hypothetical protein